MSCANLPHHAAISASEVVGARKVAHLSKGNLPSAAAADAGALYRIELGRDRSATLCFKEGTKRDHFKED